MPFSTRRKVGYFYDPDVGNFYYAQGHPMKPHRMRMTHNLLLAYGLFDKMDILTSPRASEREMTRFHSDEYINFLKVVTPDNMNEQYSNLSRFNILEDCPVFDGLWEYCQIAAGGSLAGAARLNSGESGTVINWAGGLHHAKRTEASGFCYINDCVLAILELLKVHARVLYVDIDIHHGDGVEEAFYTTDRVMTVSFHKFGDYFPGTGDVTDIGTGRGKNYSVNFPLKDGINDDSYREIFTPVMKRVMEWYQPGAVVMQCGADSLSGDRLGCFNLSLTGHSQCVDFFGEYDVPLLLLGGGGYTIRNVARCWAYETSRVLNADITDELPFNENYEFYGPEFRLHISTSNMEDHNTPAFLNKTKAKILEQLRGLPHAPSVPFADVPRTTPMGLHIRDEDSDNDDPDVRKKSNRAKHIVEYDGSDDDADDDQYLSSLRVARKKVRKSSFPRRSASRVQRTSTTLGPNATSNSPSNPFTASNAAELAPVVSMSAVNGSHMPESGFGSNHAGLLVQTRESATAATSDERLERQPGLFPLGSGALDTNVDSSTGGNRTGRNRYLDSNVDRKRARTDGGATQWDANTRPGGGPSNKESGDAREVGTVRDRLSPSRKKNNESPTPENMDISDEPKARHGAEVRTLSPVHSTSLRGASPSPEKVMMEDVTPANPPAKTSKDKEMNVVKEPPSVGSTEVLASVSKQSPSVSTHDTADKTEPVKSTERATGTDASSLAKSVHAADKSGDNARPQKENNGHPKLSDEEGALKPDAEVTASRPTSENIKVSSSSDIRQTGSETIRGPKDVVAGTKKDGQSTVVKAGSPSELDKLSFGSFVKDGDMSRPSHLEEKLSRGTKDNKNLPKSSHKIGPGAPKSPSKRPSPPRKVSPVSQLPTAKVSELSESAEKYGTDKSEKSSQDDKRIGAGDKLKVMGSGPAGSDDDPPRKAGGNLAPVKPAVTNSEHKPSSAKDAAANPEKEGLQSSPGVGSEGTSVTGMVSAPGKSAAPVDAANKSGSSGP